MIIWCLKAAMSQSYRRSNGTESELCKHQKAICVSAKIERRQILLPMFWYVQNVGMPSGVTHHLQNRLKQGNSGRGSGALRKGAIA